MPHETVDEVISNYTQARFLSGRKSIATVDPIAVIEAAYKAFGIAKTLGLFADSSIENAIGGIQAEINRIYQEIEVLHRRIDAVRNELIAFVLEVEYRNILLEVVSLTNAIGALQQGEDRDFLNAAYLDSAPNELKLLDRLDENTSQAGRAVIYLRYLDLFIMHANCRLAILLRAPSLPLSLRITEIMSLRDNLQKYCLIARDRLFDAFLDTYSIRLCDRDVYYDDDHREIGAIESWGYTIAGETECTAVTRISMRSGQGDGLIQRNRQLREEARNAVELEIRRLSRQQADEVWERVYQRFTVL